MLRHLVNKIQLKKTDAFWEDALEEVDKQAGVDGWRIKAGRSLDSICIKVNPMEKCRLELVDEEFPMVLKQ